MKNAIGMAALTMALCGCTTVGWRGKLASELPVFGHRNWIVVADMAYPKQSAPGIETIYTDAGQIETNPCEIPYQRNSTTTVCALEIL